MHPTIKNQFPFQEKCFQQWLLLFQMLVSVIKGFPFEVFYNIEVTSRMVKNI
ncbi:hypothetical protein BDN70DRAFT_643146 [Pholiota conissans]|uniref:Uncharacterized protein n=1 Tax=Pholiota conissans TaxID=109636 RepID=A0A9P6CLM4_9AGAR|nr:hypothetical protein BDN70DRAFT_643146 [Pholiota conissans]